MYRKSHLNLQMMSYTGLATLLTLVTLNACATPSPIPTSTVVESPVSEPTATLTLPPTTIAPTKTPEGSARYQLTFEATWSAVTHPTDFPPNPHFSGLIGASHSPAAYLWNEGETATPGIENMAETGAKSPLDSEIDALIANGRACAAISGGGINLAPGTVTVLLTVSQDCPVVSVVSMIAPSPDWFVGVSALSLYENGAWVEQRIVELFPYDAGTDSGGSYVSPNEPTGSAETIHRIETEPLLIDGVVPPLGTFTFSRLKE
jgi:hypothetical protein